jgi:hypothetical protein
LISMAFRFAPHTIQFAAYGFLLGSLGCGARSLATYPVSGVVKFEDGTPVSFGIVELRAESSRRIARGKLDRFGRFELGTFSERDGAVPGRHRAIVVQPFAPEAVAAPSSAASREHRDHEKALVSPKFASYDTSPLVVEVKAESANEASLIVSRFSALRRAP